MLNWIFPLVLFFNVFFFLLLVFPPIKLSVFSLVKLSVFSLEPVGPPVVSVIPVKSLFFVTQYEFILKSSLLDVFNYTTNIDKKRGKNIINYVQFLINGKDRITQRSSEYYSWIQNYQNFSNAANEGINIYSFSLKNEEYQPSGACNFSKIEDITLGLSVDNSVNYNNPLRARIYALSYNVLRIINGVCSLAFD